MKTVIVGLPLFAKRLKEELSEFDAGNKYLSFNTYYSKTDQLKALWHIPRADCVFSINGTIVKSRVFDMCFKHDVPLVINWAGSDVLKSLDAYRKGNFQQHYIDKAHHYCEADWLKDELKEMGIDAKTLYYGISYLDADLVRPDNKQLTVLVYIPEHRTDFYGLPSILKVAKKFPSIRFIIVGTKAEKFLPLPENIEALGWVDNMEEIFQKVDASLRFTEHDGLSNIVRESLGRGKQVLYKFPLKHCLHCPDEMELEKQLSALNLRFENGENLLNVEGAEFIRNTFERKVVLSNFINEITEVVENK